MSIIIKTSLFNDYRNFIHTTNSYDVNEQL